MILLKRLEMCAKIVLLLLCAGSQLWICFAAHVPDLTIVRGEDAQPHEVPSMVQLVVVHKDGKAGRCAGTLIHPQFVLTAAHCLRNIDGIVVLVGCHLEDCSDKTEAIASVEVAQHPDYAVDPWSHDIGVIKLSKPAVLKAGVVGISRLEIAATMPARTGYYLSKFATAYGWGLGEGRTFPKVLQKLDGKIRPTQGSNYNVWFGRKNGAQGVTCGGDSGGPVFLDGVQIAVISRGAANCELDTDAVFTRVDYHRSWIDSYVNTH